MLLLFLFSSERGNIASSPLLFFSKNGSKSVRSRPKQKFLLLLICYANPENLSASIENDLVAILVSSSYCIMIKMSLWAVSNDNNDLCFLLLLLFLFLVLNAADNAFQRDIDQKMKEEAWFEHWNNRGMQNGKVWLCTSLIAESLFVIVLVKLSSVMFSCTLQKMIVSRAFIGYVRWTQSGG